MLLCRLRISALPPHRRLRVPVRPITSADGDETSRTTVVTGRDKGAGTPVGGKAKRRLDQQVGAGRVLPRGAAEKEMKDNTKVKQVDKKGRRCVHARHVGVWCTLGGRTTSRSDFTNLRAPRVCGRMDRYHTGNPSRDKRAAKRQSKFNSKYGKRVRGAAACVWGRLALLA